VYIEEEFLADTGWTRNQLLGDSWQRIIAPEDLPCVKLALLATVSTRGRGLFCEQYRLKLNNGKAAMVQGLAVAKLYNRELCGIHGRVWRID
jgi:hypothetical protein